MESKEDSSSSLVSTHNLIQLQALLVAQTTFRVKWWWCLI